MENNNAQNRDIMTEISNTASDVSPITDIKVIHPDAGANSTVDVLYCFDSDPEKDKEYNYIYNNLPSKDGKLSIKLPFAGTAFLDPNYEIIKVDSLNLYFALNKDDGATIKYEKETYFRSRFCFEIKNSQIVDPSSSGKETSISWNFEETWNADLSVNISRDNICNIIARISLIVRKRNDDSTRTEPFRLPVFLTSEYEGKPTDSSIKLLPPVKITVRTSPIVSDIILKSAFTGNLNEARCYSSSGVASLPNGRQAFLVAGGMNEKDITFKTGNASMDALVLENEKGLINLDIKSVLSKGTYRTTGQAIRDSEGVQYFVVAGGYNSTGYSSELEVFRVESDGSLTKVDGQTATLPVATDHMTSTVITYGKTEYIILVGGYSSNHIAVYSIGLDGKLLKVNQNITTVPYSICGAAVGMMSNNGNRYLIIAGGVGVNDVFIYRVSSGGFLTHEGTLYLQTARGDAAYGVIEDINGSEYFVVAGGHMDYTYDQVLDKIDVFGFDEKGTIIRIDSPQPNLSQTRFDLAYAVLNKRYFIAAGGYTESGAVSNVIDMFSISTDGILKQEKSEFLKVPTASAVSGVISNTRGKQYFVIAGGSSSNATTNAAEAFELSNPKI